MPFYQGQDPLDLSRELSRLESLTAKAINGEMIEKDFQEFEKLFFGVSKTQYSGYVKAISAQLTDENLHKLITGLAIQSASQGGANTFLRGDSILKGLLLEEARRHGLTVTYPPLKVPETIPDAILDHYQILMKTEAYAKVFNGAKEGQDNAEMRAQNIQNNIKFIILNTLVLEATSEAPLPEQAAIAAKLATNSLGQAEKLYADIAEKVKINNGKAQVQAGPLGFTSAATKSPEEVAKISKELAFQAAVECSEHPKYKMLRTLNRLDKEIIEVFDGMKKNDAGPTQVKQAQNTLNDLVKQHKSLRKSASISYELGENSKVYKLLMSGNEKTVARLVEKMLPVGKTLITGGTINPEALEKNSPPELVLKMLEIAQKVEDRRSGKISSVRDGLNKFANGVKRAFSFGIGDKDIQDAIKELESVSKNFVTGKTGQSQSSDSASSTSVIAPPISPAMDSSSSTEKPSTFTDKLNNTARTPALVSEMHTALLGEVMKVKALEPENIGKTQSHEGTKDFCTNFCYAFGKDILGKELKLDDRQRKRFEDKFEKIFNQVGQEVDKIIKAVAKKHGVSAEEVFSDDALMKELTKSIVNAQKQKKLSGYKELTDICSELRQISEAKPKTFADKAIGSRKAAEMVQTR